MNAQDLKNSILQLAIQGKLVEQREEGTAKDLITRLLESKKKLLKENKIYKKNPTDPFYNSEELPFDIPESWSWVQLSDISIIQEGAGIRKYQYRDSGIQLFSVTNILEGSIDLEKKQLYVSTEEFKEKYAHLQLNIGDIVTACSGGSWGKVAIYDNEATVMLNTSTLRLRFFEDIGDNEFLYHLVQSAFFKRQLQEQLVGIQPNFGYAHYSRICLPLPPLEEQKRIVAKIESLKPYLDKYDVAYSEVEELNKKFPEDIQKSILQYAIQGKLVKQQEEDGTAEELYTQIKEEKKKLIKEGQIKKTNALPEITEDEIPFDIPKNWKWVRIGEIYNLQAGKNITSSDIFESPSEENKYPCYGGNGLRGYVRTFNREGKYALIGRQGALCGNINFAKDKFYATEHAVVVDHFDLTDVMWSGYFLKALNLNQYATATAQPGLAVSNIIKVLIPLPPLEEQKRIVAKIEELMPYYQQLLR